VSRALVALAAALVAALVPLAAAAYPIDGYDYTGIRRLQFSRMIQLGEVQGRRQQPGQYLMLDEVVPRWTSSPASALPVADAQLTARLREFIPAGERSRYGVALLDLSDPKLPRYAAHNGELRENGGSVGKLVVALALFQALADAHPDDVAARERVLRDTRVVADAWSQYDHHDVPFWNPEKKLRSSRAIRVGDEASLWEFVDWMMSASSNAAASMVMKELVALRRFGAAYPPPRAEYDAYFAQTPAAELGRALDAALVDGVRRNGLDPAQLRQGSAFTGGANARARPVGGSYATPAQLVLYMFRMDAGQLVDAWSSRELKRLSYLTQKRIRYASHPALNDAAVYFKSGSLYQCSRRGACAKYKGDVTNRLASVALVESPAREPRHRYVVAVMSNVLRVNSAVAHQTLALRLQRLVESLHPDPPEATPETAFPAVPVDAEGDAELPAR
jgi:hypothetical protein